METRAHHVLVGLLTVLTVAAALLFGLWLAKSSSDRAFQDYDIVFNEAVSGLSQGAAVQYNGIRVGSVTQLKLDPQDPRRVLARVRLDAGTPVRTDTRAKLALTGVTGLAIIQLSGGSPGAPPLAARDGRPPVIVADPSPLAKLLANGEDIMTNVNEVVDRIGQLLSDDNVQRVARTLDHLDQTTAAIAGEREDIRSLLRQLNEASRSANATLQQAGALVQRTSGLVDQQGRATLDSARAAMASVERIADRLDTLLAENRQALDGGIRGLGDLGPAIRELRQTLESLRGISRRLDENPAGYLLGRDKSKEFVP
ncbi:MlaD family protein [Fulvimonas soli]|jgi:phospholipid/cholesterol/gamma-HCH transport system substrate-binding protein|uniref:Phospholipid/cholesterol/gamma-HCH transport system substrate-binding protein n=1 Tax=Fulvimonas soli TaxID=155197 RepID=A0A316I669_9GAMM|nr:MlaD family protein [Fulvimonas soli]PWK88474.1 phospholipid/cholesterol/gamma-HCH transport system substrate-binding protein [Fulvimonas soli]TNY26876.1 ABC transporter permease [Fulvimonas soli]